MIKTADQQKTIKQVKQDLTILIAKLEQLLVMEFTSEQTRLRKQLKNHFSIDKPNPAIEKFLCEEKDKFLYFDFHFATRWFKHNTRASINYAKEALSELDSKDRIKFEWGGGEQSLENSVLERAKNMLHMSIYYIESSLEEQRIKLDDCLLKLKDERFIELSKKFIDVIDKFQEELPEMRRILAVIEKNITSYSPHYIEPKYEKDKVKKTKVHSSAKDLRDFFFNQNKQSEESSLTEKSKKGYGSSQATDSIQIWANFIANTDFSEFEEDAKDTLSLLENNNNNNSKS